MKLKFISVCVLFLCLAVSAFAQEKAVSLDQAIARAVKNLSGEMQPQARIAVYGCSIPPKAKPELSDYIVNRMLTLFKKENMFKVLERKDLDIVTSEMDYQLSGEVSDETAQALGKKNRR